MAKENSLNLEILQSLIDKTKDNKLVWVQFLDSWVIEYKNSDILYARGQIVNVKVNPFSYNAIEIENRIILLDSNEEKNKLKELNGLIEDKFFSPNGKYAVEDKNKLLRYLNNL